MSELLFVKPVFKQTIWGGSRLGKMYPECPAEHAGECWTLSAHENGMGVVSGGTWDGMTLAELWKKKPELFGNEDNRFGDRFPLLVKLIDAEKDLSIQVHPDDEYARVHENGSLGKMECWYVLDCKEDASIIIGHNAKDDREMRKMIREKKWDSFLRKIPVKKGDFFQIDPGCVHAIKGGTFILETQQSSDITYRVYDYGRLQNGKLRPLHLKKSMEVIRAPFVTGPDKRKKLKTGNADLEHLVTCEKYSVEKYDIHGRWMHNFRAAFTNLTVISGTGIIDGSPVKEGESLIVPCGYGPAVLKGEFSVICSWPECTAEKQAGKCRTGFL